MFEFGPYLWLFVVVGGVLVLGAAIAFGELANRKRSPAERASEKRQADTATHEIYRKE